MKTKMVVLKVGYCFIAFPKQLVDAPLTTALAHAFAVKLERDNKNNFAFVPDNEKIVLEFDVIVDDNLEAENINRDDEQDGGTPSGDIPF